MQKWTTKELKKYFHEYFESKNHVTMPSSSVVPQNDPSLLFVNSGMVQFKNIFLGETPKHKRVNTVQHCIRAGGKHNDLDDVGKDNYHHTFFEMMGNWSFGDYFKEDAIKYAYEFLVEVCGLDKERLYVTVYDEMDKDSREIWSKYMAPERIISSGRKDNFWEMGEFGPCGPCTEIHYDRIGGRDASALVNQDDPNVLEIWNVVFMEYNNTPKGLIPLAEKKIDTGIGLERLLSILCNVKSNYLIDTFAEIISFTEKQCDFTYEDEKECNETVAFRVVADHARTLAICIFYGVPFSNDGIGYVLRRILRRAVRYATEILGIKSGALSSIVAKAAEVLELSTTEKVLDVSIVDIEEKMFQKTLKKGLAQLEKIVEAENKISSENLFLLYDTYGFPKDLTNLIAEERGIPVDESEFQKLLEAQKDKSRGNQVTPITINFPFEKTQDDLKYTTSNCTATLQAIVVENEIVTELADGEFAELIFDQTCFYGECGGQVGDKGIIKFTRDSQTVGTFNVEDTKLVRGYVIHCGKLTGSISETATLSIDVIRRGKIRNLHSACHILGGILKKTVDESCEQQGSYVDDTKCTYDYNFKGKPPDDQISEMERRCNEFITENATVTVKYLSREKVDEDPSIILMKNVTYPEPMRVVEMVSPTLTLRELCGGTHVSGTGTIKKIRIIGENGVSGGIRRLAVVSGAVADKCDENVEKALSDIASGEVASLEPMMPVVEKRKIEIKNRDIIRKKNKILQVRIKEIIEETKQEIITKKLSKLSFKGKSSESIHVKMIPMIRTEGNGGSMHAADKKSVLKAAVVIGGLFTESAVDGLVMIELDNNEMVVCMNTLNNPELLSGFTTLRQNKEITQGTINKKDMDGFMGMIL